GDLSRHPVAVHRELYSPFRSPMPGSPKLGLEIIIYVPADVVQEFGNLARVVDKYVVVEPLEKVLDSQIGLLLTYRVARRFEKLAEVRDIGRKPRQVVLGDIRAHLDVAEACKAQIRDNIDSV